MALCLALAACGANQQKNAINHARAGIIAASKASEIANKTTAEVYATKPPEDEESYCRNKIAGLIFAQVDIVLAQAADAVLLWEQAFVVYLAKKDAGGNKELEWAEVLSTESAWFQILAKTLAVMDGVRQTLKLWNVPLPTIMDYAWTLLSGLGGKAAVDFEFDFKDLQGSICVSYLPEKKP